MAGPTVDSIFQRIDVSPKNGGISKPELRKMVDAAGVSGFFAGPATDALMDQFDSDKNGAITQQELKVALYGLMKQLAVGDGPPPEAGKMTEKVMEWFQVVDTNHNGKVSQSEFQTFLKAELDKHHESQSGIKAQVGSQIGIYLIDDDKDGSASADEVRNLALDVEMNHVDGEPVPPVLW